MPGIQGAQGAQGLQGPEGPAGPIGPQGPPGIVFVPAVAITTAVNRYFFFPAADLDLSASITVPATQFTNDAGSPAADFAGIGQGNSYDNLYINGILQPESSYLARTDALVFPPQNVTLYAGTPIVLESVQLTANVVP
ncbi:DUF4183 domain-containing protein [Cohnella sp. REN36]|nr:DUF4183 domain-containing protein [Cohnella sp. REN36]